jgi:hypothetical protein
LGDHDRAFEYLERARQAQESLLIFVRVGTEFDSLRADPRFSDLLRKLRLTDSDIQHYQSLTARLHG